MNIKRTLCAFLVLLTLATSTAFADQKPYQTLDQASVQQIMEGGAPYVLLDVGTAKRFAEKHIQGAISLPNENIGTEKPALFPLYDTPLLVYGETAESSAEAAQKLANIGYTNVNDIGALSAGEYELAAGEERTEEKQQTLASFNSWTIDGLPVDERIFADHKLTMINIWATYCGPCLSEMPDLSELNKENAERGVAVVGIIADVMMTNSGEYTLRSLKKAREVIEQTNADYLHLLPSADLYTAKLSKVYGVPETIFVDSEGNLVGKSYAGVRSKEKWQAIIDELLAKVENQ